MALLAALLLATHSLKAVPRGAGDCTNAAHLLHAATPLEKAWGAHLVLTCHETALADDLVTELAALHPGINATPETSLVTVLVDALIQLRQPVDPVLVMRFFPIWRAEATILLVQNPSSNEALWALTWDDLGWAERVAVFNTLVGRRAPGIAARLLAEVPLRHVIQVFDPGSFGGGIGVGEAGDAGAGSAWLTPGFPPAARYLLVMKPSEGDDLLADGPEPVYYRRETVPDPQPITGASATMVFGSFPRLAMSYLAALAGAPDEESVFRARTRLTWTTVEAYRDEAVRDVHSQSDALRDLLGRLISAGLLTPDQLTALHLRLEVRLEDYRSNKLPALEAPAPVDLANP